MKKQVRIAAMAALLALGGFSASAQRVNPNGAPVTPTPTDFTKEAKVILGESGGSVMVIDNKGTRKFLQSNNGITTFTDLAPNGGVVTTWQLGGTLTDDTYIDAAGKVFAIKGVKPVDPALVTATGSTPLQIAENTAATVLGVDAIPGVGSAPGTAAVPSTGYSIVVRDEATGETKKMLASDLLEVQVIGHNHTQGAYSAVDVAITVNDLPAIANLATDANYYKISVFRNGAKLRLGPDFSVTANTVTILSAAVPMYKDDVVEVRYVK